MQLQVSPESLRQLPLFAALDCEALASVAAVSHEARYATGQCIAADGEGSGSAVLHIVVAGVVRVFKRARDGREIVVGLAYPGETFLESAVFGGGPYPAHAQAIERTVVLLIGGDDLWRVIREYPSVAYVALDLMAGRVRQMTEIAADLALRRVMSRVAKLLLDHDDRLHLTQTHMAAMVGSAREVVNRSLHTLAALGVIELHGQMVVVINPEELRQIAWNG